VKHCPRDNKRSSQLLDEYFRTLLDADGWALGHRAGQPKFPLPPGAIERMDILLATEPDLYAEYASQDALIAVYFLHRVKGAVTSLLGKTP